MIPMKFRFGVRSHLTELGGRGRSSKRRSELGRGELAMPRVEALEDRFVLSTSIPLNGVSWTLMGPAPITNGQTPGNQPVSGRTAGLAAHPTDANTIYAAPSGGGVWKTTNGGTSWTPLTDGLPTTTMGAIAISASNPNIVYAGSGEAVGSGDSYYGRGVYKTTDGGATWSVLGTSLFDRRCISEIVVHPTDPNTVYMTVGNYGGVNGLTGNTGVWKTTNGGTSWTNTTATLETFQFYSWFDLVMDSSNSNVLYATLEHQGGALGGVYKTTNGGTSWASSGDFPTGNSANGRISLAISKSSPSTLYAAITNINTGALRQMMKTTNSGTNWTVVPGVVNYLANQGWYDTYVAVDPTDPNIVFAAGSDNGGQPGIIESRNGGTSFTSIIAGTNGRGPHTDHHSYTFDANNKLIDGNDGGIFRLENAVFGSILWTSLNTNISTIQFTGVALDRTNANIAYGGSQDNGTEKFNDALGWSLLRGGDGGFVRVDPFNSATVYHTFNGITLERSDNFGGSWTNKASGLSGSALFYPPFVLDDGLANRVLYGTNRVFESTNRADTWAAISTTNSGGWTTSASITALSAAKTDVNTIYASTTDGKIFVTTNRGASWTERSISGSDSWNDILVDPTNSQVAYIVRDAFGGSKVFRTTNGGVNWTSITSNLPDLPVKCIAIDANAAGTGDDVLFVGTDVGVYKSTNLGTSWSVMGTGLPNVRVTDLDVAEGLDILAAGTYGRGMWQILMSGDSVAPTITGVFYDGTIDSDGAGTADNVWSAAFRTAAGNATYGYPAQTATAQLTSMPWSTVDTIRIKFSENVSVQSSDLVVNGLNAVYSFSNFSYDSTNFVATWVLNANIDTDRIILKLEGSDANAVVDLVGNKLAGTWTEGVSTFPTSGAAAVDFQYRSVFGVGDADRNAQVRNADLNLVRNNLFVDVGAGGYSIFADVNGDGLTRNTDLNVVRNHLFIDPPVGPGPFRATGAGNGGQRGAAAGSAASYRSPRLDLPGRLAATLHRRIAESAVARSLDELFAESV